MVQPLLAELADVFGVSTEFWDWKGRLGQVSDETVVGILRGMGVDASTPEAAQRALDDRRQAPWRRPLPAIVVVQQSHGGVLHAHVAAGSPARVDIVLEDGGTRQAQQLENWESDREIDGRWVGRATFAIPPHLPPGYHRIDLHADGPTASATLVVSPDFLGFPAAMGAGRVWGYATQLYSVRSAEGWGMGDLDDLGALATWSAVEQGAGYVLVNPLHAAEPVAPIEPSPYLPASRRYVNPLYIRPEAVAEYATADEGVRARVQALRAQALAAAPADRIDRNAVWPAKLAALAHLFAVPRTPARELAFAGYRRREGEGVERFAVWCVLAGHYGMNWRSWPAEYRRPDSPAVAAFAAEHAEQVAFHVWLQWVADTQLRDAQAVARDAGMPLGVVNDLAVGVSRESADAWTLGDAFAEGVSVGAPADHYNQLGQDWGQAPWRPDRLEELAYAPFRTMVAAILRHSGGVRIDHVMGLFRLWWIPQGAPAHQGSYVRYDHEAMVGILVLEAHRAGALVVGEDLGTVEPWVRTYLRDRGILGTSIAWFEAGADGTPLPPEAYRDYCMASVTTHDLPPTAGYLRGNHIRLQHELGLLTEEVDQELGLLAEQVTGWRRALDDRGLLDPDEGDDEAEAFVLAMHRYLARTPARVLNAALTDAVGDHRTQNQPGTVDEYPNWRVPLGGPDGAPLTLADVFASARARRLGAVMNGTSPTPRER